MAIFKLSPKPASSVAPSQGPTRGYLGAPPPGPSAEFSRIDALPRRSEVPVKDLSFLRKPVKACDCVARWGFCIRELNLVQKQALSELSERRGLLAPIGVGHGKTGIDVLAAMVVPVETAVLLVPAKLKRQFLTRDYFQWSAHFHTPNLAGECWEPGKPTLHVLSYEEFSNPKNSTLIRTIKPDLIVADEAHSLKATTSSRTKRVRRAILELKPRPMFVALSGTMTTKSIFDYFHLSDWALAEKSPAPRTWEVANEWSAAVDPVPFKSSPGVLAKWMQGTDSAAAGLGRRIRESEGVVSTRDSSVNMSLYLQALKAPKPPPELAAMIARVEDTWERPDGEELALALDQAKCVRQLSCGFYYRWKWPRGESVELQKKWLAARKAFYGELRVKLKTSGEHADSTKLLENAAARYYAKYEGDLPVWRSKYWPAWAEIRDACQPETETVWCSDYLVQFAAKWAKENTGIVWYEFSGAFESKLRQYMPVFGGGMNEIEDEKGDRTIAASIKAHGTGKNLQRAFSRALILTPPTDGAIWEQLLGRLHRQHQKADEVWFDVMANTEPFKKSVATAQKRGDYMSDTWNQEQKLLIASWV